jgi:hypothetical protein
MIDLYNLVPTIYSRASRDFQYLSWLFNIVLNSVKHNVDDMYNLPDTRADSKLIELLAITLGFKVKRHYDQRQLATLVSILPIILKNKGTEKAITAAAGALVTAGGSSGSVKCMVNETALEVTIPEDLADITLFIDLLPYILPAGMTCRIIRKTIEEEDYSTEIYYSDHYRGNWEQDLAWDETNKNSIGLAGLFTPASIAPNFANYNADDTLNVGLLDNTVIPTLDYNSNRVPTNTQNTDEGETE